MSYEENRAKVLSLFESVQGGENSESENGLELIIIILTKTQSTNETYYNIIYLISLCSSLC